MTIRELSDADEKQAVCLQVLQQMWKNITGMTAQTEGAASCGKGDR